MKSNFERKGEWQCRRWYHHTRGDVPPVKLIRCTPRLRDKPWFNDNCDATVALLGTWFLLAAAGWVLLRV